MLALRFLLLLAAHQELFAMREREREDALEEDAEFLPAGTVDASVETVDNGDASTHGGDVETLVPRVPAHLSWMEGVMNEDGEIPLPALPNTPLNVAQRFHHPICFDKPDTTFDTCETTDGEQGHYRYVQYCEDMKLSDYYHFISNLQMLDGKCLGVCCPETTESKIHRYIGCGVKGTSEKIVSGQPAAPHEWPWMAALIRSRVAGATNQFCGGALISETEVLTAAHCVNRLHPSDMKVRLGEYKFTTVLDGDHKDYGVASIKIHENYNEFTFINDIAILTLNQRVVFTKDILPVCLPVEDVSFLDRNATVIGWGTIYYGGPISSTLMKVTVPVWSNEECDAAYPSPIPDEFLCAGGRIKGMDSCEGDSGGPLMVELGANRKWTIIGVVSWGAGCALVDKPGVYTRVSKYLNWISRNTSLK